MHRKSANGLIALAAALTLLLSACQSGDGAQGVGQDQPTPAAPTASVTTPAAVPTVSPTPSPTPSASPKPKPPSYDVKAVQTQLTQLKYYIGAIDGERGGQYRAAVMAFQKVNGLSADGSVGKFTLAALKAPKAPQLRGSGGGTRVEIDLTKQVLYLVKGGVIARILPVSSGNGKKYLTKRGTLATALTPVGYYKVQRRIYGERKADLGTLYDPQYFYRGWAVHGSNSVPGYPASHGCIRVTRTDAKWLLKQIFVGTNLYIYGGKYTFTAGSSAPGTDDPGGDTPDTAAPPPAPSPAATPSPAPSPTPSPSASPSASPVPTVLPTP